MNFLSIGLKNQEKSIFLLKYSPLILEICFFIHLTSSLVGWNHKLNDYHSFRQCQTAISTYYTIKDGFSIKYATPVLGKPWSIPMEFPLYQWLVSAIVLMFHTPLDQTGRFISLISFYLALFPAYSLLRFFNIDRNSRFIVLSFILLSPTYLFWSKTFMIESFTFLLCVLYIWAAANALEFSTAKNRYLILACIFGSLAGLSKITTFIVFCLPCSLLFILFWFRENRFHFQYKIIRKYILYALVFFIIPGIVSLLWIRFSDHQKSLNPLADCMLSQNRAQIYGTLGQKLNPRTWIQILDQTRLINLFGNVEFGKLKIPVFLFFALVTFIVLPGRRIERTITFFCFLFPLLIFTNLYAVHDYYFYANNMFLLIFSALTIITLLEKVEKKPQIILSATLIPLFLFFTYSGYRSVYKDVRETPDRLDSLSQAIRANTNENDVLLIYGFDFDSTVPYYSQRRALMDRQDLPLNSPLMKKALENLDDVKIKAMLTSGRRKTDFIKVRTDYFNLNPEPLTIFDYSLYISNDTSRPSSAR